MWWMLACTDPSAPSDAEPAPSDTDTPEVPLPVDADDDGVDANLDCDDTDPTVYPGAPEICGDDRVTDCDRTSDDQLVTVDGLDTFTDLGLALAAAQPGSELRVCPGFWRGVFVAPAPVDLVAHTGQDTVLDGEEAGTTLTVPAGSTVTGFTILGGNGATGGGLWLSSAGELTVSDCTIRGNRAVDGGGIAIPDGSSVVVSGSTIAANTAERSGGGIHAVGSDLDLTGSVVQDNTSDVGGGGVALFAGTLVGGLLEGNESGGWGNDEGGGGLFATGTCAATGTEIRGNEAENGAGIAVWQGDLTLADALVTGNVASTDGGGARVTEGAMVLTGTSEVVANRANSGGGVLLTTSSLTGGVLRGNDAFYGGGLFASPDTESEVTGTELSANTGAIGGGVAVYGGALLIDLVVDGNSAEYSGGAVGVDPSVDTFRTTTVTGGTFTGNTAPDGGAFSSRTGDLVVTGAVITGNVSERGGAFWLAADTTVTVTDSTVTGNQGNGAVLLGVDLTLTSVNTDWGTSPDDNLPNDVVADGTAYGYGADATFGCEEAGGCVSPALTGRR